MKVVICTVELVILSVVSSVYSKVIVKLRGR